MKTPLIVLELVFAAVFATQLYYFPKQGIVDPGRAEMIALLLPPLGFCICFFPLCYYAWFRNSSEPVSHWFKLVFFWATLLVTAFIWCNILVMVLGWGSP